MTDTKQILYDAFLYLLDVEELEEITVSDIVAQAQVHRNTFYYHFRNLDSLIQGIFLDACSTSIIPSSCITLRSSVNQALDLLRSHEHSLSRLQSQEYRGHIEKWMHENLVRHISLYLRRQADYREITDKNILDLAAIIACAVEGCVLHAFHSGEKVTIALDLFLEQCETLLTGAPSLILDRVEARNRQRAFSVL